MAAPVCDSCRKRPRLEGGSGTCPLLRTNWGRSTRMAVATGNVRTCHHYAEGTLVVTGDNPSQLETLF